MSVVIIPGNDFLYSQQLLILSKVALCLPNL